MKFPTIAHVAARLRQINASVESGEPDHGEEHGYVDVRLCVDSDGTWIVRWGLVDYDPAHSTYCGASSVPGSKRRFDSRAIARDLIEQCKDQQAMEGE